MKPARMGPEQLADAFNESVAKFDARLRAFLETGDSFSTASVRKATKRLRTSYQVLPKDVRLEPRVRRYLSASIKLSKAAGRVRDTDVIAAWTMQISRARTSSPS